MWAPSLALCGQDAGLAAVGKLAGHNSPVQQAITARLVERARSGYAVVRLKGGDPFVFGRGGEELSELSSAGIEVVVVPGVTAALAAPAAAGIPVTLRRVASSIAITTAQGERSLDRLGELAPAADTLVVLMPRSNLAEVAATLARAVGGSRPAAVISNATLPNQERVRGPLDRIAPIADPAAIGPPATLVLGDVAAAAPTLAVLPHSTVDGGFSETAS